MESSMEDRLRAHSAHFLTMVSLIPAQYYATREVEDQPEETRKSKKETRFWHNQKLEAQPKSRKSTAHSKEALSKEGTSDATARKRKGFSVECVRSTSLSDLRTRLHRKISEASLRRNTENLATSETQQSKRRQRRDREDEPDKKAKRLKEKQKHRVRVKRGQDARQKRAAVAVAEVKSGENSSEKSQLSFSRFEFGNSTKTATKKKNYHTLIAKAESKQKKLQDLMEQDQKRGEMVQEKDKWSKAVSMARGEKMKDDPKLLKKTVKRLEKKKLSSKIKWQERVKAEHRRQEASQKIRQQNVRERVGKIQAKKARKRAKKRGIA